MYPYRTVHSSSWAPPVDNSFRKSTPVPSSVFFTSASQPVIPAKRPASATAQPTNPAKRPFGFESGYTASSSFDPFQGQDPNKRSVGQNAVPTPIAPAAARTASDSKTSLELQAPPPPTEASIGQKPTTRPRVKMPPNGLSSYLPTKVPKTEVSQDTSLHPSQSHTTVTANAIIKSSDSDADEETFSNTTRADIKSSAASPPNFYKVGQSGSSALGVGATVFNVDRPDLSLLEGYVLEVRVGSYRVDCITKTWFLSKALMSNFSPFLADKCSAETFRSIQRPIDLANDDPKVFSLFVEWMYYGTYTPTCDSSGKNSIDVDAWVLGLKLKVSRFQNHVMDRLYELYNGSISRKTVTPKELRHVCANTAPRSLLRQFYYDLLAQYYTNSDMLTGSTVEWDAVLQEHAEARTFLLESLRKGPAQRIFIKTKEEYMVK